MANQILEISVEVMVTDQDIDDIIVSALEGGITYWCDDVRVAGEYLGEYASDQISRGGVLYLHDMEDDETYALTRSKFINGLEKYISEDNSVLEYDDGRFVLDCCNIDAVVANSIIQYALFGEAIY